MRKTFDLGIVLFTAPIISIFCQCRHDNDQTVIYDEDDQEVCNSCYSSSCSTCSCCDSCNCSSKDSCAKCAQLWSSCGPDWIITPNAGPCVVDGWDVFLIGEFIYWTVRQDHMGFVAAVPSDTSIVTSSNTGKFFYPKWRMELGFKAGIGFLTCDGWDFYANYTWLRPKAKKTVRPVTDFPLEDAFYTFGNLIINPELDLTISVETGKWEFNFNVIDFEWGRNFYVSPCLYLRPHFGLKGTWQLQSFNVNAEAAEANVSVPESYSFLGKNKIKWWGIGARAGLDSAWHFTKCFSILGEVAATALWGQFESKSFITQTNTTTGDVVIIPHGCLKSEWHSVKPVLEFFLGFRLEGWSSCDRCYAGFDVGWETQWWSSQNQFIYYLTETRWGDLGFEGLTVRARFQF